MRLAYVAVAVAILPALLVGCVADTSKIPDRLSVLSQLGPFPDDDPLASTEREQILTAAADTYWARTVALFPDAVRPAVEQEREVSPEESDAVLVTCLAEAGVNLGGLTAAEFTPATEIENLSWYTCKIRFPEVPRPPVSDEQLGYIYDYLTLFVAPCLEAEGSTIAAPPSRAAFITDWPNQNWFPSPVHDGLTDAEYAELNEACPAEVGG